MGTFRRAFSAALAPAAGAERFRHGGLEALGQESVERAGHAQGLEQLDPRSELPIPAVFDAPDGRDSDPRRFSEGFLAEPLLLADLGEPCLLYTSPSPRDS